MLTRRCFSDNERGESGKKVLGGWNLQTVRHSVDFKEKLLLDFPGNVASALIAIAMAAYQRSRSLCRSTTHPVHAPYQTEWRKNKTTIIAIREEQLRVHYRREGCKNSLTSSQEGYAQG